MDALRRFWNSPTWKDHARARGLLPVMDLNWERLYAVDADGRVYCSEDDFQEFHLETEPWRRHVMLSQAALRYPEVDGLAPLRAAGDPDCAACGGTGQRPRGRQLCYCGGMGWLPAGVPQPGQNL